MLMLPPGFTVGGCAAGKRVLPQKVCDFRRGAGSILTEIEL